MIYSFIYFVCVDQLVEQVCICQASVQYETDHILFRRVSVACLYPYRKIHMRYLEGLCGKHCWMWNLPAHHPPPPLSLPPPPPPPPLLPLPHHSLTL